MEWIKIDNAALLDIPRNERYFVAIESWNGQEYDWYYLTANFYYTGDVVNLKGDNEETHSHRIPMTGFYYFIDVGPEQFKRVYHINHVQYYTPIDAPEKKPDDILTIV